jgi:hypothetical protein
MYRCTGGVFGAALRTIGVPTAPRVHGEPLMSLRMIEEMLVPSVIDFAANL